MKILFCTPFGGRSGSELLLWHTLKAFDRNKIQAALYCESASELANELPSDVPYFTNPFQQSGTKGKWAKLKNALGGKVYEAYFAELHHQFKPDYWYLNTVMMAHLAPIIKGFGGKFIAHFHELPHIHFEPVKYQHLQVMVKEASLLIGNAAVTCEKIKILGGANVALVYPFVEFDQIKSSPERANNIRKLLKINNKQFTWITVGALTYAKGVSYLPDLAETFPNCHFIWVGKHTSSGSYLFTEAEIAHRGLKNVHFVGSQSSDYFNYFQAADGLLLLSKEESFGLVNLEAGYLGKPIVSFDSGGAKEVIVKGMGEVVPSWNLSDFQLVMQKTMSGEIPYIPAIAKERALAFSKEKQINIWQDAVLSL